ncbi:MAG: geranylgeranyl reductase family protein [Armatimonadetes bacterium]|nr:geranylgeranyl reductase family protein [Armatimonadota bacterium]
MEYDVIVVGLGPAGSTISYHLAKEGARVLGLDRCDFPRKKPCGGALSPRTIQAIPFDIKDTYVKTVYGGIFTFAGGDRLSLERESPLSHMTTRLCFDHFLLKESAKVGVSIRTGLVVESFRESTDSVTVVTSHGSFSGKYLIGADGVNSMVERALHPRHRRRRIIAQEMDIPVPDPLADDPQRFLYVDFGIIPRGYGWIFPKGDHLNVGIAGLNLSGREVKQAAGSFLSSHPALAEADFGNWYGYSLSLPFSERLPLARGRIFLCGEAAGLVDPFTGEGIYFAVESAKMAAPLVIEALRGRNGASLKYDQSVKARFYPEFRWAYHLMRLATTFPRITYQIIKDHRQVMPAYFRLISGETTYQQTVENLKKKLKRYLAEKIGLNSKA